MTPRQLIEWGPVTCLYPRYGISGGTVIATSVDDCVLVRDAFGQAWFYAGEVEAVIGHA